jgi:LAO/AO transport system kinase
MTDWRGLLGRAQDQHIPSTARLISALEARRPGRRDILPALHAAGGWSHVVGITGAPGTGKSTLIGALAVELRGRGTTVAVVAVDPSSPFSGGAILGDRVRMHEHALDPGVFVRSMSTRGTMGGVSRATVDAVAVLDAGRWDTLIVETIGVGQDELEIIRIAQTTVVVSVPGLGDGVQAIKAGLLEVGDVHVINKADRPDADRTVVDLLGMLRLGSLPDAGGWAPPVLSTVARNGTGVSDLADALRSHRDWLRGGGELERRERVAAAARIRAIANELLVERLHDPTVGTTFDSLVDDVAARRIDPESAAMTLVATAGGALVHEATA